jgi:hypothetical protein
MAATFTRELLSASTQGRGVTVTATATAGTLIHTTLSSATVSDEVWIYAYNSHTSAVLLTMEMGGSGAPGDHIKQNIPSQSGLSLVVPGLTYRGSGSAGLEIRAFAATTGVIVLSGHVNRATPA